MKNKKIKYAVLHFGYVESYGVGSVVALNQGAPFESDRQALESLAGDLLALFKDAKGVKDTERECCKASAKKKYCSDCGRKIGVAEWGSYDFQEWMHELLTATIDSMGSCGYEGARDTVWEFGVSASDLIGLTANDVVWLDEKADEEICKILGLEVD
jgi:hypothetical protein